MNRMNWYRTLFLPIALAAALFILAACGLPFGDDDGELSPNGAQATNGDAPQGVVLDDPALAPDFELVDHTGEPFRMSEHRDGAVAIFFGYTGCPDVCPLTLAFMAQAHAELEEYEGDITYLLITVDPERDDPDRLAAYIDRIDAPLVALTGERESLEQVWADYNIAVERQERDDGTYLVDHSAQIWLIAPGGELTMFLPMGSDGDDLARDLRWLLEQGG